MFITDYYLAVVLRHHSPLNMAYFVLLHTVRKIYIQYLDYIKSAPSGQFRSTSQNENSDLKELPHL